VNIPHSAKVDFIWFKIVIPDELLVTTFTDASRCFCFKECIECNMTNIYSDTILHSNNLVLLELTLEVVVVQMPVSFFVLSNFGLLRKTYYLSTIF
jgi:hypothetical protein